MEDLKEKILRIKQGMKVTKVVCTRSVKGRNGDAYVGFSAVWNTTQDDGITATDSDTADAVQGMDLKEAILASHLLAREADIAAHQHAASGGTISPQYAKDAIQAIKANYANLVVEMLGGSDEAGSDS